MVIWSSRLVRYRERIYPGLVEWLSLQLFLLFFSFAHVHTYTFIWHRWTTDDLMKRVLGCPEFIAGTLSSAVLSKCRYAWFFCQIVSPRLSLTCSSPAASMHDLSENPSSHPHLRILVQPSLLINLAKVDLLLVLACLSPS